MGETRITGLLEGQDVLDTASAMAAFGAEVTQHGPGEWSVHGVGVGGFGEPDDVIDCGNSGTGVRLIMGAMATTPITVTFTGDASLRGRPMARVTDPLALFGTRSVGRAGGRLPMTLVGAAEPLPVRYTLPVPSAQVKSAVLLASLNAPGETVVIEAEATRDHTERMLAGFGAEISTEVTAEGRVITLVGRPELRPQTIAVPRDPSSAAFPVCAALITEGLGCAGAEYRPQPDARGAVPDPARDGCQPDLRKRARGRRGARGRPARAVFARDEGHRGATGACRVDDRRVPHPVGGCGQLRRTHGDARRQGAAREGKRPDRGDGRRAAGLRP